MGNNHSELRCIRSRCAVVLDPVKRGFRNLPVHGETMVQKHELRSCPEGKQLPRAINACCQQFNSRTAEQFRAVDLLNAVAARLLW
jgi:hypothetical protein